MAQHCRYGGKLGDYDKYGTRLCIVEVEEELMVSGGERSEVTFQSSNKIVLAGDNANNALGDMQIELCSEVSLYVVYLIQSVRQPTACSKKGLDKAET